MKLAFVGREGNQLLIDEQGPLASTRNHRTIRVLHARPSVLCVCGEQSLSSFFKFAGHTAPLIHCALKLLYS